MPEPLGTATEPQEKRQPKRMSIERRAKRTPSKRLAPPGKPIPAPIKNAILEDAKSLILAGKTIDEIAAKHGVAHLTLSLWRHGLGDEYQDLRRAWIDGMLSEAGTLLKEAPDVLSLARARELQRRAQWYAERRDRQRYGDKQEVTVNVTSMDAGLVGSISELIERKDSAEDAQIIEEQP